MEAAYRPRLLVKDDSEDDSENEWLEEDDPSTPRGFICEPYTLYQTLPDVTGCTSWSEEPPKSDIKTTDVSKSSKYALIIRKVKCYDGKRDFKVDSIEIQSKVLKEFLAGVMAGYAGLTMTLRTVKFETPFQPFVHRWEQLTLARNDDLDENTKAHVDLLYSILKQELRETLSQTKDLLSNGVISYDLIWALFQPGATVFSVVDGRPRIFARLTHNGLPMRSFEINAEYVDYNGTQFGYQTENFNIERFHGTVPITSLRVFPLVYHQDRTTLCKNLLARGKLWETFKGYHFKHYEGPTIGGCLGQEGGININSRVVIDAAAYQNFTPARHQRMTTSLEGLSDEDYMIATPLLRGYALKNKKWLGFFLDLVKDIVWNEQAFGSLALPETHLGLKNLILAFVRAHTKDTDVFDDVVRGKGRGVVMLLSGPPGVGDLGSDPRYAEDCLEKILRMVPKWRGVLLLDEADIFMAARDVNDLQRNELVSLFLRELEYYKGIMILTTNRANVIDPAFESRIHVSLRYPDLDPECRLKIWTQFLANENVGGLSEAELEEVSRARLNGRQIKNVIKIANLLAQDEQCAMGYRHVQTVMTLTQYR